MYINLPKWSDYETMNKVNKLLCAGNQQKLYILGIAQKKVTYTERGKGRERKEKDGDRQTERYRQRPRNRRPEINLTAKFS